MGFSLCLSELFGVLDLSIATMAVQSVGLGLGVVMLFPGANYWDGDTWDIAL